MPQTKPLKPRKCKVCKKEFPPFNSLHKVCSPDCAIKQAQSNQERRGKKEAIAQRRVHKTRLEAVKPLSWHINRARLACHAYIKARDFGKPCICCGESMDWYGDIGAIHAGHWKTQAAAGNHRFNEDNIHCQKLACNLHHAGRQSQMRDGMVARIGLERVEAIEYDTRTKNWTREELLEITLMYRAKLKELKGKQ